jgi:hypothetical protein
MDSYEKMCICNKQVNFFYLHFKLSSTEQTKQDDIVYCLCSKKITININIPAKTAGVIVRKMLCTGRCFGFNTNIISNMAMGFQKSLGF